MPRWVKITLLIVMILALLGIALALTTQGHGPGRHYMMSVATSEPVLHEAIS